MGIEPTTNSLEGCDSTTELLPRNRKRLAFSSLRLANDADMQTLADHRSERAKSWLLTANG